MSVRAIVGPVQVKRVDSLDSLAPSGAIRLTDVFFGGRLIVAENKTLLASLFILPVALFALVRSLFLDGNTLRDLEEIDLIGNHEGLFLVFATAHNQMFADLSAQIGTLFAHIELGIRIDQLKSHPVGDLFISFMH